MADERDDASQMHAGEILTRCKVTGHALGIAAEALDRLFDEAVAAQAHPAYTLVLYASKALYRGRDTLHECMRDAAAIHKLASTPLEITPTDPRLLQAMRLVADQLHSVLDDEQRVQNAIMLDRGRTRT